MSKPPNQAQSLEMPLGARSCGSGGEWRTCSGANIAGEQAAIAMLSTSDNDRRLLRREIKTTLQLAAEGKLSFGKDLDVWVSTLAHLVLELRFKNRVQYPRDEVRVVRLYFSEPVSLPGVLLAAMLGAKPATEAGLDLQDQHMAEAQLRIEQHLSV